MFFNIHNSNLDTLCQINHKFSLKIFGDFEFDVCENIIYRKHIRLIFFKGEITSLKSTYRFLDLKTLLKPTKLRRPC